MSTKSPAPIGAMTFPEAMAAIAGAPNTRITRLSWTEDEMCELRGQFLQIYIKGEWRNWLVSDGDMLAQDWVKV